MIIVIAIVILFAICLLLLFGRNKKKGCLPEICLIIRNNRDYHYEILESLIVKYKTIIGNIDIKCIHLICSFYNKSFKEYLANKYPHLRWDLPRKDSKNIIYTIHATFYPDEKIIHNKNHFYISHSIDETIKGLDNIYVLTPFLSRNYFIPDILPFQNNTKRQGQFPIYIIQGNFEKHRRDYQLLEQILKSSFKYRFEIRMIGRGKIPNELQSYTGKNVKFYLNLSFQEYHRLFLDAYCILPLLSIEKTPQYYKNKLSSSISYIRGYKLKALVDKKIAKIYQLVDVETYDSRQNFKNAFENTLFQFYNPSKKNVNLIFYNTRYNFGDQLSIFITKSLLNNNKYNLVLNQKDADYHLICIGSYIHEARDDTFIFGSGIRIPNADHFFKFKTLNICSIRGPRSQSFLKDTKKVEALVPYGDAALLLPRFYKPSITEMYKEKIIFIAHQSNPPIESSEILIIRASQNWEHVVNAIYSAKGIISSSLHGLIVSDAFRKPNMWFHNPKFPLPEGDFKFHDYFESQNRQPNYISDFSNISLDQFYKDGNKLDLDILYNSFPFL